MQPNLIKAVRAPDLRAISEPKPQALRTATTPEIARQINEWMVSVVDDGIATGRPCPVSRWPARPVPRNSATA